MEKQEFSDRLWALLDETLEEGPGPRLVAGEVAYILFAFICNEAGSPVAVDEVIAELERLKQAALRSEAA